MSDLAPIRRRRAGHTIVEMMVAVAVFALGLSGLYASLDRGTAYSKQASERLAAEESSRRPLTWLMDLLAETRISFVDTSSRVSWSGGDFSSDRFVFMGLRQCASATCTFHTSATLDVDADHYRCAYEYRNGMGQAPLVRGKVYDAAVETCLFDGNQTFEGANLDVMKMFVPRNADGTFSTLADGTPRWNNLVILAPSVDGDGNCRLMRYDVFVSDLLADPPSYSPDWDRWDPLSPDMVEIFDFGQDGTTDGNPDGSVPVVASDTDAETEVFTVATSAQGSGSLIISKSLGAYGGIYRTVTLQIELESGQTDFSVTHYDGATKSWTASCSFTRSPKIVASDLTEFAVSTARSHPFDAATNPTGVEDTGVVRVTLGTSRPVIERGETRWVHHIDTYSVRPRN